MQTVQDNLAMLELRADFVFGGYLVINFVNLGDAEKEMVRSWRNNEQIRKYMFSEHFISLEEHAKFTAALSSDNKNFYWLIKDKEGEYLGVISLNRADLSNKNAFLGIYSNPDRKTSGAGSLLVDCLKKIAFEKWNLHTLKLEVIETNVRAVDFYAKAGFSEEGRLKQFALKKGKWHDVIIMGMVNRNEKRENEDL